NRIQKVLEDANIKLGSVASDVLGLSGRDMLRALIAGQTDGAALANLARGRLRDKLPQLRKALTGCVTDHHRFLLRLHLDHLTHLESLLGQLDQRIGQEMAKDCPPEPPSGEGPAATVAVGPRGVPELAAADQPAQPSSGGTRVPLWSALWLLTTIPGISRRTAEVVLAEIGSDMGRFATSGQLASWSGLCPGNHESAGQRRSGRTGHGDRWLRSALVQAAWAASRARKTYLAAQYRRLARRGGRKKALLAVAHTLLVMCYQLLKKGQPYQELNRDQVGTRSFASNSGSSSNLGQRRSIRAIGSRLMRAMKAWQAAIKSGTLWWQKPRVTSSRIQSHRRSMGLRSGL